MDGQDQGYNLVEALTPVLDATTVVELREAIQLTISRCVPNASLIKVFLRDPLTTHLVDENCRALPNSRFISDILQQRGKTEVTINHNQDSIRELLGSQYNNDGNSNSSVLLLPVPERGSYKKIGLIVVVSQAVSLSSVDPKRVNLCVKQISMSYEVIRASLNKDSSPNVAGLLSLMQLCGELNDQDAAKLEIKVMRYLQEQTEAESGFLLLVVPETQILFCQAVGDSVLQEEVRFAKINLRPGLSYVKGPTSCFATALETKQPITLDDIPLDRRQEVEKIIRRQIHSLLCVPVCINDSKDLLALACVVNKNNHQEFTETDADIIRQCFKYTATVLTSTLAFQNERKLKNQTQALLLVARKLFTRLVESKQTAEIEFHERNRQPKTADVMNLYTQHESQSGFRAQPYETETSRCNAHASHTTPQVHCSHLSNSMHLPHQYQMGDANADNTYVLLPLSSLPHHAQYSKDAEGFHTGEERNARSWKRPWGKRLARRTSSGSTIDGSRRVSDDIDDQFVTPDSSPERLPTCSKVNVQTQTQKSHSSPRPSCSPHPSSLPYPRNYNGPVDQTNQNHSLCSGVLRTSTPLTANAVPSLSQTSFGNASNVRGLHSFKSCEIPSAPQSYVRNVCHATSGTPITNDVGLSSFQTNSGNASSISQIHSHGFSKEAYHDCHDEERARKTNKFEKDLEWMNVFFENMEDFGNIFCEESNTNVDQPRTIANAQKLVTDMWRFVTDKPQSLKESPHSLSSSRGPLFGSVQDTQTPPLSGRTRFKKFKDTATKSEKFLSARKETVTRVNSKEETFVYPMLEHCHGSRTGFEEPATDSLHNLHYGSNSDLRCTNDALNAPDKKSVVSTSNSNLSLHSLCSTADNEDSKNQKTALNTVPLNPVPVSLVPYTLSDSDSFHSLSDDEASFTSCDKEEKISPLTSSRRVPVSTQTSVEKIANKTEEKCTQVLGLLISPTKRDWLQPSWKCPDVAGGSPHHVNHSLFPSEDEAVDVQCPDGDEPSNLFLPEHPKNELEAETTITEEFTAKKVTMLYDLEPPNLEKECKTLTEKSQVANLLVYQYRTDNDQTDFSDRVRAYINEPATSVDKTFSDTSDEDIQDCETETQVNEELDFSTAAAYVKGTNFQKFLKTKCEVSPALDVKRKIDFKAPEEGRTVSSNLETLDIDEEHHIDENRSYFHQTFFAGHDTLRGSNKEELDDPYSQSGERPTDSETGKNAAFLYKSTSEGQDDSEETIINVYEAKDHDQSKETGSKPMDVGKDSVVDIIQKEPQPHVEERDVKSLDLKAGDKEAFETFLKPKSNFSEDKASWRSTQLDADVKERWDLGRQAESGVNACNKEAQSWLSKSDDVKEEQNVVEAKDIFPYAADSDKEKNTEAYVLISPPELDIQKIEEEDALCSPSFSDLKHMAGKDVQFSDTLSEIDTTLETNIKYWAENSDTTTTTEVDVPCTGPVSSVENTTETNEPNILLGSDLETLKRKVVQYSDTLSDIDTTIETNIKYSAENSDTRTTTEVDVPCTGPVSSVENTTETNEPNILLDSDLETLKRKGVQYSDTLSDIDTTIETNIKYSADILNIRTASEVVVPCTGPVSSIDNTTETETEEPSIPLGSDLETLKTKDVQYRVTMSGTDTSTESNSRSTESSDPEIGILYTGTEIVLKVKTTSHTDVRHGVAGSDLEISNQKDSQYCEKLSDLETIADSVNRYKTEGLDIEITEKVGEISCKDATAGTGVQFKAAGADLETTNGEDAQYSIAVSDLETIAESNVQQRAEGLDLETTKEDDALNSRRVLYTETTSMSDDPYTSAGSDVEISNEKDIQHFVTVSDLDIASKSGVHNSTECSDGETTKEFDAPYSEAVSRIEITVDSDLEISNEEVAHYNRTVPYVETSTDSDDQSSPGGLGLENTNEVDVLYSEVVSSIETDSETNAHYIVSSLGLENLNEKDVLYSGAMPDVDSTSEPCIHDNTEVPDLGVTKEGDVMYSEVVSNIESAIDTDLKYSSGSSESELETPVEQSAQHNGTGSYVETSSESGSLYGNDGPDLETYTEVDVSHTGAVSGSEISSNTDGCYVTAGSELETSNEKDTQYSGTVTGVESTTESDFHYSTAGSDTETTKDDGVLYTGTVSNIDTDVQYSPGSSESDLETPDENGAQYRGTGSYVETSTESDALYGTDDQDLETYTEVDVSHTGAVSGLEISTNTDVCYVTAVSELETSNEKDAQYIGTETGIEITTGSDFHYSTAGSDTETTKAVDVPNADTVSNIETANVRDIQNSGTSPELEISKDKNTQHFGTVSGVGITTASDLQYSTAGSDSETTSEVDVLDSAVVSGIETASETGVQCVITNIDVDISDEKDDRYQGILSDSQTNSETNLQYFSISGSDLEISKEINVQHRGTFSEEDVQYSTACADLETSKDKKTTAKTKVELNIVGSVQNTMGELDPHSQLIETTAGTKTSKEADMELSIEESGAEKLIDKGASANLLESDDIAKRQDYDTDTVSSTKENVQWSAQFSGEENTTESRASLSTSEQKKTEKGIGSAVELEVGYSEKHATDFKYINIVDGDVDVDRKIACRTEESYGNKSQLDYDDRDGDDEVNEIGNNLREDTGHTDFGTEVFEDFEEKEKGNGFETEDLFTDMEGDEVHGFAELEAIVNAGEKGKSEALDSDFSTDSVCDDEVLKAFQNGNTETIGNTTFTALPQSNLEMDYQACELADIKDGEGDSEWETMSSGSGDGDEKVMKDLENDGAGGFERTTDLDDHRDDKTITTKFHKGDEIRASGINKNDDETFQTTLGNDEERNGALFKIISNADETTSEVTERECTEKASADPTSIYMKNNEIVCEPPSSLGVYCDENADGNDDADNNFDNDEVSEAIASAEEDDIDNEFVGNPGNDTENVENPFDSFVKHDAEDGDGAFQTTSSPGEENEAGDLAFKTLSCSGGDDTDDERMETVSENNGGNVENTLESTIVLCDVENYQSLEMRIDILGEETVGVNRHKTLSVNDGYGENSYMTAVCFDEEEKNSISIESTSFEDESHEEAFERILNAEEQDSDKLSENELQRIKSSEKLEQCMTFSENHEDPFAIDCDTTDCNETFVTMTSTNGEMVFKDLEAAGEKDLISVSHVGGEKNESSTESLHCASSFRCENSKEETFETLTRSSLETNAAELEILHINDGHRLNETFEIVSLINDESESKVCDDDKDREDDDSVSSENVGSRTEVEVLRNVISNNNDEALDKPEDKRESQNDYTEVGHEFEIGEQEDTGEFPSMGGLINANDFETKLPHSETNEILKMLGSEDDPDNKALKESSHSERGNVNEVLMVLSCRAEDNKVLEELFDNEGDADNEWLGELHGSEGDAVNEELKELSTFEGYADTEGLKELSTSKGDAYNKAVKELSDHEENAENETPKVLRDSKGDGDNQVPKEFHESEGNVDNEELEEVSLNEGDADNEGLEALHDSEEDVDNEAPKELLDSEGECDNEGLEELHDSEEDTDKEMQEELSTSEGDADNKGLEELSTSEGDADNKGLEELSTSEGDADNKGLEELSGSEGKNDNEGLKELSNSERDADNEGLEELSDSERDADNEGLEELSDSEGDVHIEAPKKLSDSDEDVDNEEPSKLFDSEGGIDNKMPKELFDSEGDTGNEDLIKELSDREGCADNDAHIKEFSISEGDADNEGLEELHDMEGDADNKGLEELHDMEGDADNEGLEELHDMQGNVDNEALKELSATEEDSDDEVRKNLHDSEGDVDNEGLEELHDSEGDTDNEGLKELSRKKGDVDNEALKELSEGEGDADDEWLEELHDSEGDFDNEGLKEMFNNEGNVDNKAALIKEISDSEEDVNNEALKELPNSEGSVDNAAPKELSGSERDVDNEGLEELHDSEEDFDHEGLEELSGGEGDVGTEAPKELSGSEDIDKIELKELSGSEAPKKLHVIEGDADNEAIKELYENEITAENEAPKVLQDSKEDVDNERLEKLSDSEGDSDNGGLEELHDSEGDAQIDALKDLSGSEGGVVNEAPKDLSGSEGYLYNEGLNDLHDSERDFVNEASKELSDSQRDSDSETPEELSGSEGDVDNEGLEELAGSEGDVDNEWLEELHDNEGDVDNKAPKELAGSEGDSDKEAPKELSAIGGGADNEGLKELTDNEGFRELHESEDADNEAPKELSDSEGDADNEVLKELLESEGDVFNEVLKELLESEGDADNEALHELSDSEEGEGDADKKMPKDVHGSEGDIGNESPKELSDSQGDVVNEPPKELSDSEGDVVNEPPKELSDSQGDVVNEPPKELSDSESPKELSDSEALKELSDSRGDFDNEGLEELSISEGDAVNEPPKELSDREGDAGIEPPKELSDSERDARIDAPKELSGSADVDNEVPKELCGSEDVDNEIHKELSGSEDDNNEVHKELSGSEDDDNEVHKELSGSEDDYNEVHKELSGSEDVDNEVHKELSGSEDDDNEVHKELSGSEDFDNEVHKELSGSEDVDNEVHKELSSSEDFDNEVYNELSDIEGDADNEAHKELPGRDVDNEVPKELSGSENVDNEAQLSNRKVYGDNRDYKMFIAKDNLESVKSIEFIERHETVPVAERQPVEAVSDGIFSLNEIQNMLGHNDIVSGFHGFEHQLRRSASDSGCLNRFKPVTYDKIGMCQKVKSHSGINEEEFDSVDKISVTQGLNNAPDERAEKAIYAESPEKIGEAGSGDSSKATQPFNSDLKQNSFQANAGHINICSDKSYLNITTQRPQFDKAPEKSPVRESIINETTDRSSSDPACFVFEEGVHKTNIDETDHEVEEPLITCNIVNIEVASVDDSADCANMGGGFLNLASTDQADDFEVSRCSQESSQPDATEFEESNLSSEDGALEADVSSFDSTLLAPSSGKKGRNKGRKPQTMKYCMLASARNATGSTLSLPKFYSVYSSESGEDFTENRDVKTTADPPDLAYGQEKQETLYEVSAERSTVDPIVSENSRANPCEANVGNSHISMLDQIEAGAESKQGSIRVRKDRYSSFFGFGSASSNACLADPSDHDAKCGSFVMSTNSSSELALVTGLPPKSQKKKPKQTQLRIACLEKATSFSPKRIKLPSPQNSPGVCIGCDSNQGTEPEINQEIHDSTLSGSGSIQLDSMYYTDSCDSPSTPGGENESQLGRQQVASASVWSVPEDFCGDAQVRQVFQPRKNLEHLYSTPIQAPSTTPELDSDFFKVSPIESDDVDLALKDTGSEAIQGSSVQADLLGMSGLEVFPDTNHVLLNALKSLESRAITSTDTQASEKAANITTASTKKKVCFDLPYSNEGLCKTSQDQDQDNSKSLLSYKPETFPSQNLHGGSQLSRAICLDTLPELKEDNEHTFTFKEQPQSFGYMANEAHQPTCRPLEINYDPFMAGRAELSKSPRLSVILEEEQDASPDDHAVELSGTFSLSTTDDSLEVSLPPLERNQAHLGKDTEVLETSDPELSVKNSQNVETNYYVELSAEAFLDSSQPVSYRSDKQSGKFFDDPEGILDKVVSEIAKDYTNTSMVQKTFQDKECEVDNSDDECNSMKSQCTVDKISPNEADISTVSKPSPTDATGHPYFSTKVPQESTALENDILGDENMIGVFSQNIKTNVENVETIEGGAGKSTFSIDEEASCETSDDSTIHLQLSVNVEGLEPCNCLCTCGDTNNFENSLTPPKQPDESPPTPVERHPWLTQRIDDEPSHPEDLFLQLQNDCNRFLTKADREEIENKPVREAGTGLQSSNTRGDDLFDTLMQQCSKVLYKPRRSSETETEAVAKTSSSDNSHCLTFEQASLIAAETEAVSNCVRGPLLEWRSLSDDEEKIDEATDSHSTSSIEQGDENTGLIEESLNADSLHSYYIDSVKDTQGLLEQGNFINEPDVPITAGVSSEPGYERRYTEHSSDDCLRGSDQLTQHLAEKDTPLASSESSFTHEFLCVHESPIDSINKDYFTLEVTLEGEGVGQCSTAGFDPSKHGSSDRQPLTKFLDSDAFSYRDASTVHFNNAFRESNAQYFPSEFTENKEFERYFSGDRFSRVTRYREECSENQTLDEFYSQKRGFDLKVSEASTTDQNNLIGESIAYCTPYAGKNKCVVNANSPYENCESYCALTGCSVDEMKATRRRRRHSSMSFTGEDGAEFLDDYSENIDELHADFQSDLDRKASSDSSASDPDILNHTSSTISDPVILAELRVDTCKFSDQVRSLRHQGIQREVDTYGETEIDTYGETEIDTDRYSSRAGSEERYDWRTSYLMEPGTLASNVSSSSSNTRYIGIDQAPLIVGERHIEGAGDEVDFESASSTGCHDFSSSGLLGQSDLCDFDYLFSVSGADFARLEETGQENAIAFEASGNIPEADRNVCKQKSRYHKFFIGNCDPDPSYGLKEECREWSWYVNREPDKQENKSVTASYLRRDNLGLDNIICSPPYTTHKTHNESHPQLPPHYSFVSQDDSSTGCPGGCASEDNINQHEDPNHEYQFHHSTPTSQRALSRPAEIYNQRFIPEASGTEVSTGFESRSHEINEGQRLSPVTSPEDYDNNGSYTSPRLSLSPPEQARGNVCPQVCQTTIGSPTDLPQERVEVCSPSQLDMSQYSVRSKRADDPLSPAGASWSITNYYDEVDIKQFPGLQEDICSREDKEAMRSIMQKRRKATTRLSFQDVVGMPTVVKNYLEFQTSLNKHDLTKLLREIMQEARNLTDAERCSVFLIDKDTDELVAMVFDGITADDKEVQGEIRLPKTQGIAGHVATTGTLLNIRDAYSHPLFYRGIDDSTGFRTRNILCFPIKDEDGVVLGVAQLCNKKTFQYFTTFDEDIASAFAVYCCISISHSLMYKKVIDIQYRNSLANELMMFHMKSLMYKKLVDTQNRHRIANELVIFHINQQVPTEEVSCMAMMKIPPIETFGPNFDSFDFAPRTIPESQTVMSCLSMFEDLGFISRWRVKSDTLVRFLLMVKKGYRNPPYHNWMHAFAVTHFCYLLIKNLHLHNYLEDIELLALFVSCLCHDIDHRGTTNSFQVQSQSVLAALYSSEGSVMERHHLAQSMCILNTEGSNLFENLSSKEYQTVLDLMRDIILATDLAHHLRTVKEQEELAKSGAYNKNDPRDKNILLCLLMTACDLSDQTKNWNNTKYIAALVYQEFFSQGDLEKALGKNPLEMMDRERACVPELQISFLDNIAAPVYKILAAFFKEAETPARNVEENRKHWVHIGQLLKRHGNPAQAMSVEQIISIEDEEESPPNSGGQVNGR